MATGRLIISKAGYEASPSLDDAFKAFDSNWPVMGRLIAQGVMLDPSASISGNVDETASTAGFSITFPQPFRYVPYVKIFVVKPSDYPGNLKNDIGEWDAIGWRVSTTAIAFTRKGITGHYGRRHMLYQVFGI
jgi:hypothetical protein